MLQSLVNLLMQVYVPVNYTQANMDMILSIKIRSLLLVPQLCAEYPISIQSNILQRASNSDSRPPVYSGMVPLFWASGGLPMPGRMVR